MAIHSDPKARKETPIFRGVLMYFPDAIAEVARVSYVGNKQHNPGEPMHWARGKSMDQEDCLVRHLMERGQIDSDGLRHTAKAAWRALALLQLEIEADAARDRDVLNETFAPAELFEVSAITGADDSAEAVAAFDANVRQQPCDCTSRCCLEDGRDPLSPFCYCQKVWGTAGPAY